MLDTETGSSVLEIDARPGLGIQLANRRGLKSASVFNGANPYRIYEAR